MKERSANPLESLRPVRAPSLAAEADRDVAHISFWKTCLERPITRFYCTASGAGPLGQQPFVFERF